MIVGLYKGTLFFIQNQNEGLTDIRLVLRPSNWFRNQFGMIVSNCDNGITGRMMAGYDFTEVMNNVGVRAHDNHLTNYFGFILNPEGIFRIDLMAEQTSKVYPQLKKPGSTMLSVPVASRITDWDSQLEFYMGFKIIPAQTAGELELDLSLEEYIDKVYKTSLNSNPFGQYGYVYQITVDNLMEAFKLAQANKYAEIDKLWLITPTAKISVKEYDINKLKDFNWGNLEML